MIVLICFAEGFVLELGIEIALETVVGLIFFHFILRASLASLSFVSAPT
jgi:hypothetical protein